MPVPPLHLRAPLDGGVQHGPGVSGDLQAPDPSPSALGAVASASSSQAGPDVHPSTSRPAQRQTPNIQPGVTGPSKGAKGVPGRSNLAAPGDGPDAGQAGDGPPPPENNGGSPGNDGPGSGGDAGNGTDGSPPPPTSQPPPPVTSTSTSRSSTSKPTITQSRPTSTIPPTSLPPPTPNAPNPGGGGSTGPPPAKPGSPPPSSSDQSPPPAASSSLQPPGKDDFPHGSTNVSDKPQTDPVHAQHHDGGGTYPAEDKNNANSGGDNNGGSASGGDYHHGDSATSGSANDPLSGSGGVPPDHSTGLPGNPNTDHKRGGLPAAGVAALVIALVLLVVAGIVVFLRRRKKRHGKPAPQFVFVGQSHYQDLDEGEEKLSPLPERGLSAKLRSSVRRNRAPRWSGYSNGMLHIPRSSAEMSEGSFVICDAASDRSSRISQASASSFTPTVSTGVQFAAPSPPPTARPFKFSEDDPFADPCNSFMDPYCTRAPSPKLSL